MLEYSSIRVFDYSSIRVFEYSRGYGKNSDGGIFENSNMEQRFEANLMNENLPGQNEPCPHVLIGDEAFALKPYLMRHFPYKQSRTDRRIENFNTRLCRAKRELKPSSIRNENDGKRGWSQKK
ncbi:hypothetical protein HUJ04_000459 [Dendroctonus ponderosae]|nr:hypothetical protein HUJ04_000459 [Dendroctonus ponderosae]